MCGIHATDEVPPTMVDVNPRFPPAGKELIREYLTAHQPSHTTRRSCA
jgi:hypothetical protein